MKNMKNFKMMPVAVALVASFAAAQSNEDVQKQLARQDAELKRLNAELTELKANGAMTAADAALETEVNRLSERLAAATTVKSGANQITFVGEFRSALHAHEQRRGGHGSLELQPRPRGHPLRLLEGHHGGPQPPE
jgi:regulator of replication initiation timing